MTTEREPITTHDSAAESEHLLNLTKMSATAGAGTAEYVAINVTAVLAVLCGVASILAFLGNILLVIPVAGVVLAFIAMRQISRSNGTETGKRLAWTGLALSILIGGGLLGYQGVDALRHRSDEEAISALCQRFGELIDQNKLDDAYELFDSSFHDRVNVGIFRSDIGLHQHNNVNPPISGMEWNGITPAFQLQPSGDLVAVIEIKAILKDRPDSFSLRWSARLRKSGSVWRFDSVGDLFPTPHNPQAAPDEAK